MTLETPANLVRQTKRLPARLPLAKILSCAQIMVSVSEKDLRPDLPEDPESLPGGTFDGWDTYVDLIRRCWATDPAERPTFEAIIATQRELLTQATLSRQRRLTTEASPEEPSNPATPRRGSGTAHTRPRAPPPASACDSAFLLLPSREALSCRGRMRGSMHSLVMHGLQWWLCVMQKVYTPPSVGLS
jgi:hypothetical protein